MERQTADLINIFEAILAFYDVIYIKSITQRTLKWTTTFLDTETVARKCHF